MINENIFYILQYKLYYIVII